VAKIDLDRLSETMRNEGGPAFRGPAPTGPSDARPDTEQGAQRVTLLMPRPLHRRLKAVAEDGPVGERMPQAEVIRLLVQLWTTDDDLRAKVAKLHKAGDQARRKGPPPRWG